MNDFYCAAPWRGLHINPRGDIKTCCAGDPNMLGNLNTQTIEQVLHGPIMQEIRQSIQQGRPHSYCRNCVEAERYGRSERDWHNRMNPELEIASAQDYQPVLIDVRWNTTCNLSCNYCDDKSSSRWANLLNIDFRSGARPYYDQVCDYLEKHASHIKQVALVGGEPMLLKENERLLDVIPDHVAVNLITNLSVDLAKNAVFKKLQNRHRVGWNVSMDNIGQRFEYVRYGSQWTTMESNINTIKSCAGHEVGIHSVYNIYSATRLIELTQWARQHQLSIQWQSLYQPAYLDPLKLGPNLRRVAREHLETILSQDLVTGSERTFLQRALTLQQQHYQIDLTEQLVKHIDAIETVYHPNTKNMFSELWPEISSLL